MELIIMFGVAIVVVILAGIAIIGGLTERVKRPTGELKEQISNLEKRVNHLEDNNK
ncbi:hypothetical protein ACFO3D_16175 [Virgibacillus kekensis]|uniref:DUF4083 domain-containing protein n=1 Tax=Virgibacillus kekensis TaxID=202261 RepID=A0ABV9DLH9_9BACI